MSVTSSMWTAVSGLLVHGEKMNVVGNNIANVNTMAFKSQRMDFEDFVYQDTTSANGFAQIGRGANINAIMGDFSQGAQERSNTVTDISINGKGFFKVRNPNGEDDVYYTRAGNFRFNKNGELVDPSGNFLQGWEIERTTNSLAQSNTAPSSSSAIKGSGVPKDITLGTFTCVPQHTQKISILSGLSLDVNEKTTNTTDPFFGLLGAWDATDPTVQPPLGTDAFGHQTTFVVYDEGGQKHELTVYFDKVQDKAPQNITNWDPATQVWEYLITMNPLEDNRTFGAAGAEVPVDVKGRGMLMSGTLSFSTAGILKEMSAFVPGNDTAGTPEDLSDLANWVPAPISNNGKPMLTANFSGIPGVSSVYNPGPPPETVNQTALPFMMEIDFGISSLTKQWTLPAGVVTAADVVDDIDNVPSLQNPTIAAEAVFEKSGSSTSKTKQDGYGFGYLQNVLISKDGVLSARYDNGITLDLWQITIYDFMNNQGLYREGGNLFSETRDSGSPMEGAAGSSGLGQVYSNALEMSNVDLAQEFVYMIATQRGFQYNSKTITTVDTMLEQVINMKR